MVLEPGPLEPLDPVNLIIGRVKLVMFLGERVTKLFQPAVLLPVSLKIILESVAGWLKVCYGRRIGDCRDRLESCFRTAVGGKLAAEQTE